MCEDKQLKVRLLIDPFSTINSYLVQTFPFSHSKLWKQKTPFRPGPRTDTINSLNSLLNSSTETVLIVLIVLRYLYVSPSFIYAT